MMKKRMPMWLLSSAVVAALVPSSVLAEDKSTITYVGGGRYTCRGDTVGCALIKENNRQQTRDTIERSSTRHKGRAERERRRDRANERYESRSRN